MLHFDVFLSQLPLQLHKSHIQRRKYNRGHPKVNDNLRKFPYFSLDSIRLYSLAFVQQALLF
jgi:hypothetical protein